MKCAFCKKSVRPNESIISRHIQDDGTLGVNDPTVAKVRASGKLKDVFHKRCWNTYRARQGGNTKIVDPSSAYDASEEYKNQTDRALEIQAQRIREREEQPDGDQRGWTDWREDP